MYLTQTLFFALAAIYPAVIAEPHGVTCETTDGSPSTSSAQEAIDAMELYGSVRQSNAAESKCTTLAKSNDGSSAAIAICGHYMVLGDTYDWQDIARNAQWVADECESNGKVAGTSLMNTGHEVKIIIPS